MNELSWQFEYSSTLESNEVLVCKNCEEIIQEEADYDWEYYDNECQEFICPNCNFKHQIQIHINIEKDVFIPR